MKKYVFALVIVVLLIMIIFPVFAFASQNEDQYESAMDLLKDYNYSDAASVFSSLGNYADSPRYTMYCKANALGEQREYGIAILNLASMGDFLDSALLVKYYTGLLLESECRYSEAYEELAAISLFRDSMTHMATCLDLKKAQDYEMAVAYEQDGKYKDACSLYASLGDYRDSKEKASEMLAKQSEQDKESAYNQALTNEEEHRYDSAAEMFRSLKNYRDSSERALANSYKAAKAMEEQGRLSEALDRYIDLGDYEDSAERALKLNELINVGKHGRINSEVLYMRKEASRSSRKLAELKSGSELKVYETVVDNNGDEWVRIEIDGVSGYVMKTYVDIED